MNSFLSKLVDRHVEADHNIKPRIRGRFDADSGFSSPIEDENPPTTETQESYESSQASLTQQRKKNESPTAIESKKDKTIVTGPDKYLAEPSSPLLSDIDAEDETLTGKPIEPVKINTDSIHANKKPADDENSSFTPVDRIITRWQNRYLEKNHFIKPEVEKKQPGKQDSNKPFAAETPLSFSKEPDKPALNDNNTYTKENNEIDGSLGPVSNKSRQEYVLQKELTKTTTHSINVSIGRIEIRALLPQVETRVIEKKEDTGILSLDKYLEQRNTGKR
jgi:hypothetical protein